MGKINQNSCLDREKIHLEGSIMEAIILDFKKKTIKLKNIDTEKISYLEASKKGLRKGDVISVKIDKSNFSKGFLFINGKVEKINNSEYTFDECLRCGDPYLDASKPLCRKCWKELREDKKPKTKKQEKKRKLRKDSTIKEEGLIYKDFRKKYKADFRAYDGHWVRSRAEKMIDDCLFRNKVLHIYEPRIPGEKMLSDFYIPKYQIWIEYWGRDDKKYNIRKDDKIELYKKHGYYGKLIELSEGEISSIDDVLEEKLTKQGVKIDLD